MIPLTITDRTCRICLGNPPAHDPPTQRDDCWCRPCRVCAATGDPECYEKHPEGIDHDFGIFLLGMARGRMDLLTQEFPQLHTRKRDFDAGYQQDWISFCRLAVQDIRLRALRLRQENDLPSHA